MLLSHLVHDSLHVDVSLYFLMSFKIIVLSLPGDCIFCHEISADPDELSCSAKLYNNTYLATIRHLSGMETSEFMQ